MKQAESWWKRYRNLGYTEGMGRSSGSLLLGLGVVAGAVAGWFFSDKANRLRAERAVKRVSKQGQGVLAEFAEAARKGALDAQILPKKKVKRISTRTRKRKR
jgi:hypothetical protein